MKKWIPLIVFLLLISSVSAQIPDALSLPFLLLNTTGSPIQASNNITINIYDALTGGSPLYNETQNITTSVDGVGSITLHSTGLNYNTTYYVEVSVLSEVLAPRLNVTPAPYAQRARNATFAAGVNCADITGTADDVCNDSGGTDTQSDSIIINIGGDTGNFTSPSNRSAINLTAGDGLNVSVSGNVFTWLMDSVNSVITKFTSSNILMTGTLNITGDLIVDGVITGNLTGNHTLDQAYDSQSGTRTVTVDDGALVFDLISSDNLTIQFDTFDVLVFDPDGYEIRAINFPTVNFRDSTFFVSVGNSFPNLGLGDKLAGGLFLRNDTGEFYVHVGGPMTGNSNGWKLLTNNISLSFDDVYNTESGNHDILVDDGNIIFTLGEGSTGRGFALILDGTQDFPSSFTIYNGTISTANTVFTIGETSTFQAGAPSIRSVRWVPLLDNTYDLGVAPFLGAPDGLRWKDLYLAGTIKGATAGGSTTISINAEEGSINLSGNFTAQNITVAFVNSKDWTNVTITESQISDLRDIGQGKLVDNGSFLTLNSTFADNIFVIGYINTSQVNINHNNGIDDLNVNGTVDIDHTAVSANEHALEIEVFAEGFGDVKAIDIVYDTGGISIGEDEEVILIEINQFDADGGSVAALEVLATEGSGNITALEVGALVNPLLHLSGSFADMDNATVQGANALSNFTSADTDSLIFENDNDDVVIGDANKFEEIEFILNRTAGGAGISPTFEFSTGVDAWTTFTPADGTNGMKNTGVIAFEDADIPSWAVGTDSLFYIRITRTKNNLPTIPIEKKVQIAAVTEYSWDKDANLFVNRINASILNSDDWTNVSIPESQISDLQAYLVNDTEVVFTKINSSDWTNASIDPDQLIGDVASDGLVDDVLLTSNMCRLDTVQAFTALQSFDSGLNTTIVNASISINATNFTGGGAGLSGLSESQITDLQAYLLNNSDVVFNVINSSDWRNVTVTESQVTDLSHTTDTNESTRVDDIFSVGNLTGVSAGGDLGGTYPNPTVDDNFLFNNADDSMAGNLTLHNLTLNDQQGNLISIFNNGSGLCIGSC